MRFIACIGDAFAPTPAPVEVGAPAGVEGIALAGFAGTAPAGFAGSALAGFAGTAPDGRPANPIIVLFILFAAAAAGGGAPCGALGAGSVEGTCDVGDVGDVADEGSEFGTPTNVAAAGFACLAAGSATSLRAGGDAWIIVRFMADGTGVTAPHCPQNLACSGSAYPHCGQERVVICPVRVDVLV